MREIKFRGKRLDNGEWEYGDLVAIEHKCGLPCQCYAIIPDIACSGELLWKLLSDYEVDLATVGQYTGLKDKNGKEIWEDDVMRFITEFGETMTSEVAFMNGFFYVQGEDDDDIYGISYAVESMNAEIIGNIHDTPELLKTE